MSNSWNAKLLCGAAAMHTLLGTAWALWVMASLAAPAWFIVENLALAALGFAAAIGALRRKPWVPGAIAWFYAFQLFQLVTPSFTFSANLGLSLNLAVGWNEGVELGVNMAALAMFAWACITAFAPNNSSKPTPLRGAA